VDLPVQRVVRPRSVAEATALLAGDPDARPVAGGTDLVVQLRAGRRRVATLVDISGLELAGIRETGAGGLSIGATTSMAAIARDPRVRDRCPALAAAAGVVGAWPIQCRATLGGNLANASPAADTAPALLIADAAVVIATPAGSRTVPLEAFFLAPGRTALLPGELVVAVVLPAPPGGAVERFVKLGPRREQVIAVVSLAGRVVAGRAGRLDRIRLALGAVAPTPVRARRTERLMEGRIPDRESRQEAALVLQDDIAPIDDVRAPARYRRVTAAVLLDRFLEACLA
jgi:CO/xanthine dehydrogenase FAD-binding subunit